MKFVSALAAAAIISGCSAVELRSSHRNATEIRSYGFIIELEPGTSFAKRRVDVHTEFHKRAQNIVADYRVRHEFKNRDVFYGVSIDAKNHADVQALLSLPEVKNVWQNRYHDRPEPVGVPITVSPSTAKKMRTRDAAEVVHVTGTSDVNSALKMTGVDAMHKLGFKGQGVKIAILDTGVDYRHPALGGGFGPGFKVAGGYDLVGDDYTGANSPLPDDDPLVSCLVGGHGTHVAGIIGAQDPDGVGFGLLGVAPEASLYTYRILGCNGGVTDEVIIQGFEKAANDGPAVISMSVGGARVWETASPFGSVFEALKKKGIALIVAAGNNGDIGPYFASWPALDPSIISVGSVSNTKFTNLYNAEDSAGSVIEYASIAPLDNSAPWHIFFPDDVSGTQCDQQAWADAVANFPDPKKVIGVVDATGPCAIYELLYWTEQTGIVNFFFYRGDEGDLSLYPPGYLPWNVIPVRTSQAQKMLDGVTAQGLNYTLSFGDRSVHDVEQPTSNTVSYFSSFGPTMEMSMKPQLSGPGGNILSTWPTSDGVGYALISGTSMSTPHVSGCYALLKQAHPELTPDEILHRLQSTSTPLAQYGYDGLLTSTIQQGSGLINVLNATNLETALTPTELNLRDSSNPPPQQITIENKSSEPKTYTISHKGASQVNTMPTINTGGSLNIFHWYENNSPNYASVSFSTEQVTVQPGAKTTITATIVAPSAGIDPDTLPLYGGYIIVTEGTTNLVVPYAGVPYTRNSRPTLDFSNLVNEDTKPLPPAGIPNIPMVRAIDINRRNNDLMTFTFPSHLPDPDSDDDQDDDNNALFIFVIRQPTMYVRLDVVHPHQKVHPDAYGFDRCHRFETNDPQMEPVEEFLGIPSYGQLGSYYGGFDKPVNRFAELSIGFGYFSNVWAWAEVVAPNGTLIQMPNADYRVLIRALKWGYDWQDPAGYESWLSPIMRVNITDPGYENPFEKLG